MTDIMTLVQRATTRDDQGDLVITEISRDVFCGVRSIGLQEFYQASTTDFHPELKLVLADYLDYHGEKLVDYNGLRYRVIRAYHAGLSLELTVERAPVEDGGPDA